MKEQDIYYIECRHMAVVKSKLKDGRVFEFYPFVIDKYTGQPRHTGYTQVTKEELKQLKTDSNVFKAFIKKKLLIVREEVPLSVQSPAAIIASKDAMIAELRTQITNAEGEIKNLKLALTLAEDRLAKATAPGKK